MPQLTVSFVSLFGCHGDELRGCCMNVANHMGMKVLPAQRFEWSQDRPLGPSCMVMVCSCARCM